MFQTFDGKFFASMLGCVELEWSARMYQCAGICYLRKNGLGMSITIRLSEPLLKLRSRKDLVETLLHEMIHAWNFVRGVMQEENGGHGKNFLAKMHEINRLAGTNITVYHTFRDEVELYKKHWWRCDGACKNRGPFYGFVKRTSNRAPGKNDRWWADHQAKCGGNFIKVKEPTPMKKKKAEPRKRKPAEPPTTKSNSPDIRKFFKPTENHNETFDSSFESPRGSTASTQVPKTLNNLPSGGGSVLGGTGSGRSKLLDMFDNINKSRGASFGHSSVKSSTTISGPSTSTVSRDNPILDEFDDDDGDIILIDGEFDDNFPKPIVTSPEVVIVEDVGPKKMLPSSSHAPQQLPQRCHCPICDVEVETAGINEHLDQCAQ